MLRGEALTQDRRNGGLVASGLGKFSGRFDRSDFNAGGKARSSRAQDDGGNLGILGLLSVASLDLFRGASKGALFDAYLSPTQFEDSKAVRGVLACYFSRQPSSLL